MNHDFIEANDLAARYVAERLSVDEQREFEAHLVDCARCADEVEQELGLRQALRTVQAGEQPEQRAAHVSRRSGVMPGARFFQAAAAVLLVAAIGLALSLARMSASLRASLAARQEQHLRAETTAQTAQSLERRVAELEQRVSQPPAPPASQPVLPVAVFALTAIRGAASADAPPVNRITIAGADRLVVFTVELPPLQGPPDYMVSLRDRAGREVWSGGPFRPSTPDSLAVAVDRALLQNGVNTFEVRQRTADRRLVVVGRYPFEIRSR
jgi:hypothetical protein